jgi:hypothetical protein
MLETCVEMWRHIERFQCTKEGGIDNSINSKDASKDLSAKGRKGWRRVNALLIIFIIWEFIRVIDLVGYPTEN